MNLDLWNSLSGILTLTITGADPERTLQELTQARIRLSRVQQLDELTYQARISRKDLPRLSGILRSRGDRLEIIRKNGLYWSLEQLIRRPVLVAALVTLLFSAWILPTRIFFVSVEGNHAVPARRILSAAEDCGISFGASRKQVRSERVKNALLSAVPQLQWVGVNTSGCTAVISVRERGEEPPAAGTREVSNVIADRDGYILSTVITGGSPMVFPGDTVTRGQLLISGYTDCGIFIRASRAAGEITAQTNREITAVMPDTCEIPAAESEIHYEFSLILGKKRINLWKDSRISDTGCGRMYEEYFVSLPGGFRLPVAFCVDRYVSRDLQKAALPETEAQNQLQTFSEGYVLRQMVAGRILQKQQALSCREGLYRLDSSYVCTEMIGREHREQIGVINGKRN